jgi:GNAT superfamily N-acetyltransferase
MGHHALMVLPLRSPGGPLVRRAVPSDLAGLTGVDPAAAAGDDARRANLRRWCDDGLALLAEDQAGHGGPLGYCVLEYTFFEQGFVTMLMVAPTARRQGVGSLLLRACEATCVTPKLFTSTNVSNHPMRQLLRSAGWSPAGLLHGLDEGDPELFHLCPAERLRAPDPAGAGTGGTP